MRNKTKIKYLKVLDKVYEVTKISFFYMTIEAIESDLSPAAISEDEIWSIDDFINYKVRLINSGRQAEIIDFEDWKNKNSC